MLRRRAGARSTCSRTAISGSCWRRVWRGRGRLRDAATRRQYFAPSGIGWASLKPCSTSMRRERGKCDGADADELGVEDETYSCFIQHVLLRYALLLGRSAAARDNQRIVRQEGL